MLDSLITSKTRIKLLLKFFLNAANRSYLRNLANEFGESSNSIRVELNRLENAGLLTSETQGNRRYFTANQKHPLFEDITNIVRKYVGVDQVIENIVERLGNLKKVYLSGSLVKGVDSGIIQILLVGDDIDRGYLSRLAMRAEEITEKKISYLCFNEAAFEEFRNEHQSEFFLIWQE